VTWCISLPNSSSSSEVSAIFGDGNFMTLVATLDIYGIVSRYFISISMAAATGAFKMVLRPTAAATRGWVLFSASRRELGTTLSEAQALYRVPF